MALWSCDWSIDWRVVNALSGEFSIYESTSSRSASTALLLWQETSRIEIAINMKYNTLLDIGTEAYYCAINLYAISPTCFSGAVCDAENLLLLAAAMAALIRHSSEEDEPSIIEAATT